MGSSFTMEVGGEKPTLTESVKNLEKGADKLQNARYDSDMSCQLFEVEQVCGALKIGRSTLYKLVNSRELKAVKLLGRTLFRPTDVAEFVDSLTTMEGASNGY